MVEAELQAAILRSTARTRRKRIPPFWQIAALDIEGDIDYVDAKDTANVAFCASCTFKNTWLGTIRGRIGYSFDRWLPYLTAGGAYGNMEMETAGGSLTKTKAGWTAGTGVEYAFLSGWSAKLEYLYVDLGSATCGTLACLCLPMRRLTLKPTSSALA